MPVAGFIGHTLEIVLIVVGLLSGTLAVLREVQLMYLPAKANEKKVFWAFARIAFVIAAILLWSDEHAKVVQLYALKSEKPTIINVPPAQVITPSPSNGAGVPSVAQVMASRLALKKRMFALSREISDFEEDYNKRAPKGNPWVDDNIIKYYAGAAKVYNEKLKFRVWKLCRQATDAGLDVQGLDRFEAVNVSAFS